MNLNDLPKEKLDIFLNVIQKLKQKVIIKWIPNVNVKLSKNIMTGAWFPQNDILGKKFSNTKNKKEIIKYKKKINDNITIIHNL